MKKLISVILIIVLLLFSSALAEEWTCLSCGNPCSGNFCSNCGAARPAGDEDQKRSDSPGRGLSESDGKYSVTGEFSWQDERGNYYALVIKNTSGSRIRYKVQFAFYDISGNLVEVSSEGVDVCDDGYEVLVTASCKEAYDHVEYTISTEKEPRYFDVHSFVSVTARVSGQKIIVTGENTGPVNADFVRYDCLLLDEQGNVVGNKWGFLVDDNDTLPSGERMEKEETCREDFSSVLVFFEGRAHSMVVNAQAGGNSGPAAPVSDQYEITHEYAWSNRTHSYYALVVRNRSGETCGFTAQIEFRDEEGNVIGVSDPKVEACGDGYEILLMGTQETPYDHVSWKVNSVPSEYEDVHSFMNLTVDISGKKVFLTAKNDGLRKAELIRYHCLFLDSDGNVVDMDWGQLHGSEGLNIKPGETGTSESRADEPFDRVAVYYNGKCEK